MFCLNDMFQNTWDNDPYKFKVKILKVKVKFNVKND